MAGLCELAGGPQGETAEAGIAADPEELFLREVAEVEEREDAMTVEEP